MKTLNIKRTCESVDESCGDAGPKFEFVTSKGDGGEVKGDSVDGDDKLVEDEVDQYYIERRPKLKLKETNLVKLLEIKIK